VRKSILFYLLVLFTDNILACVDSSLDNTQNFVNCLKSAEQGDAISQFQVGVMYSKGQGTGVNNKKAVQWFRKSAESSDQLQHIYQGKSSVKADQRGINKLIEAYGEISNIGTFEHGDSFEDDSKIICSGLSEDELSKKSITFSTEYFNEDNPLSTASSNSDEPFQRLKRQLKVLQIENRRLQRQINDLEHKCGKE